MELSRRATQVTHYLSIRHARRVFLQPSRTDGEAPLSNLQWNHPKEASRLPTIKTISMRGSLPYRPQWILIRLL